MNTPSVKDLRKQMKATSLKVLDNKIKEEDKNLYGDNQRTGYLSIEEGSNKFRILPKLPGEETYYTVKVCHWITVENDKGEEKRKPVFNSRTHGKTKMDIFEEYIRFTKEKNAAIEGNEVEATRVLKEITAFGTGILPSTSWITYAYGVIKGTKGIEKTLGELELNKSVRDGMNRLQSVEDAEQPIEVEPFTDPDSGRPILVDYKPNVKDKRLRYGITLSQNAMPLTDAEVLEWSKLKPLSELYSRYSLEDFELACEGLQIFDDAHEIGTWKDENFQEIIDAVRSQYDADSSKSSKNKDVEEEEETVEEEEQTEEVVEEVETDEFADMDRDLLKKYIFKNKLAIKVFTNTSDEEIREKIRELVVQVEGEEQVVEEEVEEEIEEQPVVVKKTVAKPTAKPVATAPVANKAISLQDIKNKLLKKK